MLRHLIQKERERPIGEKEILKMSFRKGLKTLEYDSIRGHSIKSLLPGKTSGVLLLFMDHRKPQSTVGHWCLLFKSPEAGIEFFDPLGLGYRTIIKMTKNPSKLQKILSKGDAHVNKHPFQSREHAQTCARHCITRWNAAHLSAKDYAALLHDPRLSPDEIVTMFTLEQNLTTFKA